MHQGKGAGSIANISKSPGTSRSLNLRPQQINMLSRLSCDVCTDCSMSVLPPYTQPIACKRGVYKHRNNNTKWPLLWEMPAWLEKKTATYNTLSWTEKGPLSRNFVRQISHNFFFHQTYCSRLSAISQHPL